MATQFGHQHVYFTAPEAIHDELKKRISELTGEQDTPCMWWHEFEKVSDKDREQGATEELCFEYISDDYPDKGLFEDLQAEYPDIAFRYVETGMSWS